MRNDPEVFEWERTLGSRCNKFRTGFQAGYSNPMAVSNSPDYGGVWNFGILGSSPTCGPLSRRLANTLLTRLGTVTTLVSPQKVQQKVGQSCEPIAWIDVFFDHVEGKVVRPAKRPNCNG